MHCGLRSHYRHLRIGLGTHAARTDEVVIGRKSLCDSRIDVTRDMRRLDQVPERVLSDQFVTQR